MKKKKKKTVTPRGVNISRGGRLLYNGPISGIPVGEAVLIVKSIEFFSDPEPCFIHRSAVQARLYAEFEHWLDSDGIKGGTGIGHSGVHDKNLPGDQENDCLDIFNIDIDDMPAHLRGYFLLGEIDQR